MDEFNKIIVFSVIFIDKKRLICYYF